MKPGSLTPWFRANRFWVVLAIAVFAGYAAGKDAALRDNVGDALRSSQSVAG